MSERERLVQVAFNSWVGGMGFWAIIAGLFGPMKMTALAMAALIFSTTLCGLIVVLCIRHWTTPPTSEKDAP